MTLDTRMIRMHLNENRKKVKLSLISIKSDVESSPDEIASDPEEGACPVMAIKSGKARRLD